MTVSYPGVYIREVTGGVRPIQAAGTSTAAFFGRAERGPIGSAVPVVNFAEFQTTFGGFLVGEYLAHAVFQFFNNGGTRCYVVRIAASDADFATATIRDRNETPKDSVLLSANSKGVWGNTLEVDITDSAADPANTFDLTVYRNRPGAKAPAQLEQFIGLSMDPFARAYLPVVVNGRSKYLTVAVLAASGSGATGFVEGTAVTGAPLDTAHRKLRISVDDDGFQEVDLTGVDVGDLSKIATALQDAIRALRPLRRTAAPDLYTKVTVTLTDGDAAAAKKLRVASGTSGATSSVDIRPAPPATDAAGLLGLGPGAKTVGGAAVLRPQATTANRYLIGDGTESGAVSGVNAGSDGGTPQGQDYVAALPALDTVRDVSLIAIPGVGDEAVVAEAMNYCERRPLSDCFFIADMDADHLTAAAAMAWRKAFTLPNSYGAVYFPWLRMLDPDGGAEPIPVPPSGFVAGVYARTDNARGVWKTPAGTQAGIAGVVDLMADIGDVDHGTLNADEVGVCVIRRFPSSGIVIWGGRTLTSDSQWRYISPRRMAIFLRVSIFNGIQWAVFEPNDEPLWSQLRLNLNAFMMTLFRRGAFQGATPNEAFFVKVDSETTTQADIDNGQVNILVGFAPLKPAEFVVVQLSQMAGQTS